MEPVIKNSFPIKKWIWFTSAGWIIGLVLIIFPATVMEELKIQAGGQASVGIGMGFGVGLMQWLVLKEIYDVKIKWMWLSFAGFAVPFLLFDLAASFLEWKPEIYVPAAALLGAFFTGWLQYRFILKNSSPHALKWITYCIAGWTIATGVTFGLFFLEFLLPRVVSIILAFAAILIGGPLLGWITGKGMAAVMEKNE